MQPLASMHQALGERGEGQEGREGRAGRSRSSRLVSEVPRRTLRPASRCIRVPGWKLTVGKANALWGWFGFCWLVFLCFHFF